MVVVAGWMADERTTDHAQIVFKSHNECSKETTFRGKVVAEKENLCFTVIESFSRSRVGVISSLLLSTLLLLRVFRSLRETAGRAPGRRIPLSFYVRACNLNREFNGQNETPQRSSFFVLWFITNLLQS